MTWYLSCLLLLLYILHIYIKSLFRALQYNLVCENQFTGCRDTSWMKFVTAILTLVYSKEPYIFLKIKMCKTYYIILSYSKTFYNVLYNKCMILNHDLWQFVTFTCDVTLTPNPKSENKIEERKIKILSSLSSILIIEMA